MNKITQNDYIVVVVVGGSHTSKHIKSNENRKQHINNINSKQTNKTKKNNNNNSKQYTLQFCMCKYN